MARSKSGRAKPSPALVQEILELAERDVRGRRANIFLDPSLAVSLREAVRKSDTGNLLIALERVVELFGIPSEYNDPGRATALATSLGRRLESFGLRVGTAEAGRYLRFALLSSRPSE